MQPSGVREMSFKNKKPYRPQKFEQLSIKFLWTKCLHKELLMLRFRSNETFFRLDVSCRRRRKKGYFNLVLDFLQEVKNAMLEIIWCPCTSLCRDFFLVSFTVLFTLEYLTFFIPKEYETGLNDPLYNITTTTKLLLIIYYYSSSVQFKIVYYKQYLNLWSFCSSFFF